MKCDWELIIDVGEDEYNMFLYKWIVQEFEDDGLLSRHCVMYAFPTKETALYFAKHLNDERNRRCSVYMEIASSVNKN